MATINDVCKLAGVSKTTVSRVINNSQDVSPETLKKVLHAIKMLDYQPNALAQAFASNISNSIGLALPHFDSNYFGCIMREAAKKVQHESKKLLVMDTYDHIDGEMEAVLTLAKQRCDVIVLYSRYLSEAQLIDLQNQIQPRIIVLNRTLLTGHLFSFGFSQEYLGRLAVDHLISLGHRKILCITTPLKHETGQKRLSAYKQAMQDAGVEVDEKFIIEGHSTIEGGYEAILKILDDQGQSFSAVYAGNDSMAFGALRAFYEKGINVPNDVSIVGIDNDHVSAFSAPSLTSVSVPIDKLTIDAFDLALRLMKPNNDFPAHFEYRGELKVRESSRKIN